MPTTSMPLPASPRSARSSPVDTLQHYQARLATRRASVAELKISDQRFGGARLLLAALFIGLLWLGAATDFTPAWALLPALLFVLTVALHRRVRRRLGEAARAVTFYELGCARMVGTAPGTPATAFPAATGVPSERFADQHHLYATDLDLFGRHSLFQRLCVARTIMGEETLAAWLLAPAELGTVLERQNGVRELRDRFDLREHLAIRGEPAHIELDPQQLLAWARAEGSLPGWLGAIAGMLCVAAAGAGALWAVGGPASALLAVLAMEAALLYRMRDGLKTALSGVEGAHEQIRRVVQLIARIEAEDFTTAPLRQLRSTFRVGALPASALLSRLATIVNFVEARRNPFLTPLLTLSLYSVHTALAADRWRRRHGPAVAAWLGALGELEALLSLAAFSAEHPDFPFPEFLTGAAALQASGLGHPLIAAAHCVRNDIAISGETRILMVSGSNMSGKSTLLRAIGINTVLAMAGAPVCAVRFALTPLQVGASIRVNDSLSEGSSRFYAEITRLRQLFEARRLPLLFLLDELLQGTNSSDRQVGARGVLHALLERGAIGMVSTHDLALSDAAGFGAALRNVHLRDELRDGKLYFDFKLHDGVVTHSNGIELMRAIGLEV